MFGYQKYNPEKALPEEISNLPPDQTKCKFCGVSYLVHHEVKKLEDELASVQAELDGFQDEREQLKKVPALHLEIQELKGELTKCTNGRNSMKLLVFSSLQLSQESLLSLRKETIKLRQHMDSMARNQEEGFKQATTAISNHRKQWKQIEKERSLTEEELKNQLQLEKAQAKAMAERLTDAVEEERNKARVQGVELNELGGKIEHMQTAIRALKAENENICSERVHLQQRLTNETLKWSTQLSSETDSHSKEVACLKQEISKKDVEIRRIKSLLEEQNQQHQKTMTVLQKEIEHLKGRYNDKETELREFKILSDQQTAQRVDSARQEMTGMIFDLRREKEFIQKQNAEKMEAATREYQEQVRKLKDSCHQSERAFEEKISILEQQLVHEKDVFETDSMRHISEVKELTLELEHVKKTLSEKQSQCKVMADTMDCTNSENASIRKECGALIQQKRELDQKLEEAYNEISSLQQTVEGQCVERTELMIKLQNK